jgi:hypothetical protein
LYLAGRENLPLLRRLGPGVAVLADGVVVAPASAGA